MKTVALKELQVNKRAIFTLFALLTILVLLAGIAEAKVSKANGPFKYDPKNYGTTDFYGEDGSPVTGAFTVCAPEGEQFLTGSTQATADIRVFGIKQVMDADGNPLDPPVDIPLDSIPGSQIAGAFSMSPDEPTFWSSVPSDCQEIAVTISNPNVSEDYYGVYHVKVKAKAAKSRIGVGSGSIFVLALRPSLAPEDPTPPNVTINDPLNGSSHLLGPIDVSFTAHDPVPGTGVASVSAGIISFGGGFPNTPISLATDPALPVPACNPTDATGTFTPTGGSGATGTTLGAAFYYNSAADKSLSGTGTYTLTATATDGAANTGTDSATFDVKYDIDFTQASRIGNQSRAKFHFSVARSDSTFMYDKTVRVDLVDTSNSSVVSTHYYGTGDIKDYVQIDSAVPEYKTQFWGLATNKTYKAEVWFRDVDGAYVKHGESGSVTIP